MKIQKIYKACVHIILISIIFDVVHTTTLTYACSMYEMNAYFM